VLQGGLLNWRSGDAILKPLLKRRRAKNRSPTKHSRAQYLSGEMNPDLRLILIRGAEIKTIDRAWQVAVSGWRDQKEMVQPLCDRQAMDLNASTFRFRNSNGLEVYSVKLQSISIWASQLSHLC
jgi:hypothetical protein